MGRGEEGEPWGEEWDPEDLDDTETLDDVWEEDRRAGRGARRWLLLLLVIPAVALVVLQLQPDQVPTASPTPTRSHATTSAPWPEPSPTPVRAGPPVVRQVGHRLLGATKDWEVFARTVHGVVRIQMASGRVTSTPLPGLQSNGPVAFIPTDTGVIVRPQDFVSGYAVPDGARARELTEALGQGGPVVPGPDPEHVWVDTGEGVDRGAIALVGLDGWPVGPLIGKPRGAQDWIRPDGAGYPMITTGGGVYDAQPDHLRRITAGRVLAVGPTGWLTIECKQQKRCARVVVDRESGEDHTLPGKVAGDSQLSGVIAPDGSTALLVDPGHFSVRLVDLHSGAVHRVDVVPSDKFFFAPDVMAFSPDSRWVLLIDERGDLVAVDTRTRKVRRLELGLPELDQLSVRPPP